MKTINHGLGDYTIELTKTELNHLRFFIGAFSNYRRVAESINLNPEQLQIATNIAKALYNYDVDIDLNQKD